VDDAVCLARSPFSRFLHTVATYVARVIGAASSGRHGGGEACTDWLIVEEEGLSCCGERVALPEREIGGETPRGRLAPPGGTLLRLSSSTVVGQWSGGSSAEAAVWPRAAPAEEGEGRAAWPRRYW
jgi:hypothetical protein